MNAPARAPATGHPLDLAGPLPSGRASVEASAGTGKTYAVAGIVTRLVVEHGVRTEQLLVTTFTRAAARELRERIRSRLVDAVRQLERGTPSDPDDRVVAALLAEGGSFSRAERLRHARVAVTDFDAATIGTIHSFCQRVLRLAGHPGQVDPEAGDGLRIVDEVINDLLVREGLCGTTRPEPDRLKNILMKALSNPTAELWTEDEDSPYARSARDLVAACVADVRRRQAASLDYSELLHRAHELVTAAGGAELRAAIAERYRVAVVDEGQDTDPLQWEMLEALFPAGDGERSMYVVGDPKQSIYGFRGADVDGYVLTRGRSATLLTLPVNHRSDQPLITALNRLMEGATFGEGIAYSEVTASPEHGLSALPKGEPVLELAFPPKDKHPDFVTRRVLEAIRSGRFRPRDIAVLVGARWEGAAIQRALHRAGVPAVTSGTSSVAESRGATVLRNLLRAIAHPTWGAATRLAAIEWFGTLSPAELVADEGDALLDFQERLGGWARTLARRGAAGLVQELLGDARVLSRLAATGALERHVTDLAHLGELLEEASGGRGTSAAAAFAAFDALARMDSRSELVTRRMETDAEAVQILTIHVAKGLQWPMVIVAKRWKDVDDRQGDDVPVGRFAGDPERRVLDCGWFAGRASDRGLAWAAEARLDEEARLLYVALTRAEHQLILLMPEEGEKGRLATSHCFGVPEGASVREHLSERLGELGDTVRIGSPHLPDGAPGALPPAPVFAAPSTPLETAPAPPPVHAPYRRWSFTSIKSRRAAVEAEPHGGEDEFEAEGPADGPARGNAGEATGAPLPPEPPAPAGALAPLPRGAQFGTVVHAVLERIDFADPDVDAALHAACARHADLPSLRPHRAALVAGLRDVLQTPLGAEAPLDLRLADVHPRDRLVELSFDLALPDRPGAATPTAIGRLLQERLPAGDPVLPYARRLASGLLTAPLTGLLAGFIDLVVRRPAQGGEYLIIDYKTNRLDHYGQRAMLASMADADYLLQGILYCAALHRFLRWKTGEADPSPRVAGFAYLYVRGMVGPQTPRDADGRVEGVFHWRPPPGVIAALSDLLAGVHAE